jgi:hypothetical protein
MGCLGAVAGFARAEAFAAASLAGGFARLAAEWVRFGITFSL